VNASDNLLRDSAVLSILSLTIAGVLNATTVKVGNNIRSGYYLKIALEKLTKYLV